MPDPYVGRDVLVVGCGPSGCWRTASCAATSPATACPTRPRACWPAARIGHAHGAIDRGLIPAVRPGTIEVVRGVTDFDRKAVLLDDGTSITPDVVIAATGQRPRLEGLVGHLGVLGLPGGRPVVHGGQTAPGRYFQGYRLPPGQLPDMATDAWSIARAVSATRLVRRLG